MPRRRPKSCWQVQLQRLRIAIGRLSRRRPRTAGGIPSVAHWENPAEAVGFGAKVIVFGLGSFLLWSLLAPLDEGVPATGSVAGESRRKTVSHLTGGVVATIAVRENQQVQAGDILLTMESTQTRANYDATLHDYFAAAIKLARLDAEQAFAPRIDYPAELRPYFDHPWAREMLAAQEHLFRTRQRTLAAEQSILEENLAAARHQTEGSRKQLAARERQAALLDEDLKGMRSLVQEGYAPRSRLLEQERMMADVSAATSGLQAELARGSSAGTEIRLRILQRRQEYLRDVETQVADTRREVANLRERLKSVAEDLERTVVRAPVSGQVIALQAQTVGGVVTPGSHLMEIVPAGDKLLLDVQVAPHLINRIRPGLAADIRLSAFPELPLFTVDGTVESVSSDRHLDPLTGQGYYLARITVTEAGLRQLAGRQLQPGMPVEVVIKTGERSFMTYLLQPLLKRMFTALHEI